ncbi:ribonuclease III [bacterium]|nr:ribonuclease III [bacterium]
MKLLIDSFQKLLGYTFKNESLLVEALTHKSFSVEDNRSQPHNERLEFLGDSILNFVVAEELLKLFPEEQEGVLSKKRASLVNLNKLAEVAKKFKLDQYIQFGPGEIKQGNHLNGRIQGSCIEAIIGAIYLDGGFDKSRSWVLAQFTKADFYNEVNASYTTDYKSRLQELTQKHKLGTPVYELILTTGPSHKPQFLISLKLNETEKARADGASKKNAEQKAAELYLNELMKAFKE